MIAELGHAALVLAMWLSLYVVYVSIRCLQGRSGAVLENTVWAQYIVLALVISAWLALLFLFVDLDFSVVYVAQNAHSAMPWIYRIPASWGAHEGSMMLWLVMMVLWWFNAQGSRKVLSGKSFAWLQLLFALFSSVMCGFVWWTSNPFMRLLPLAAPEGYDLNPMLQDIGLISHPPLLYLGYVGLCLPFFLYSAVSLGREKQVQAWARWLRSGLLVTWGALTLGIALGSWWAYRELGWGGWWFWDPVENVSLMPWLIATALIHANLRVCQGNGLLACGRLCLLGFMLSMVGTFLVRSGVLVSVHSFAQDPMRGMYLLGVLCLGSWLVYLVIWRRAQSRDEVNVMWDWLLLSQQLLFICVTFVVALGTLYPLFLQVAGGQQISIGPPFYQMTLAPLAIFIAFILGLFPWRHEPGSWLAIWGRVAVTAGFTLLFVMLLSCWNYPTGVISIACAVWVLQSQLGKHFTPAKLAHIGFAVTVIGVGLSGWRATHLETIWQVGETKDIAGYELQMQKVNSIQGGNYQGVQAEFLAKKGAERYWLFPEIRSFKTQDMALTKVAIWPHLTEDLYVALGDELQEKRWSVRVYIKPFVRWIWFGALVMTCAAAWQCSRRRSWRSGI